MARFGVYRLRHYDEFVLDCQADILSNLPTRFVVPLVAPAVIGASFGRLNPLLRVDGADYVMMTQSAGAVPAIELGNEVLSLADHQATIMNALDMLMIGY